MVNLSLKKLGLLVAIPICFNYDISEAYQNKTTNGEPVYYFGIQGDIRQINLKENFGKPLFKDNGLRQWGLYAGTLFNEYFGFELSYQTTIPKKHQRQIQAGQYSPGGNEPLETDEFDVYEIKQKVESIDLGITGYLPPFYNNTFFGMAGISLSKINAKMKLLRDNLSNTPAEEHVNMLSKIFNQQKCIPFIKIGIQRNVGNHLNIRFFVDWKNLAQFNIQSKLKYKNSMSYGIGLSYLW